MTLRDINTCRPTAAEMHDIALELEVMDRIEQVCGDTGDGKCPTWMLPARVPVQRLQGLKRRGLLNFGSGRWWLTDLGLARQRALREFEGPTDE